jgi:hypothetical protein
VLFSAICRTRHPHETTTSALGTRVFFLYNLYRRYRPNLFRPNALGSTVLGPFVLGQLLFEPEPVATDIKVSHIPGSSTPRVHSPVLTVNREPKVVLVEMPQGVLLILKFYTFLKGAEQASVVHPPMGM